ncbi:MAG: GAF domain-containing protein [Vicinamibacterales bacterium]
MSGSPGDVQPVLAAVAERAAVLCNSPFARVMLVERDVLRAVAAHSTDGSFQPGTFPIPLKRTTVTGRAVLERTSIHHDDIDPLLNTEYPDAVNMRRLGARAVLAVPLIHQRTAYGAILLFRREPRPFSSDRIALVETFAQQAAIAIDNARLFNETKERLEQQTATSEILQVISRSQTDVQPVFDTIASAAYKLCDAQTVTVFRFDGKLLHVAALAVATPQAAELIRSLYPRPPGRETASTRAVLTRSVVAITDILADPDYRGAAFGLGLRSLVAVPLLRDCVPIGAFVVGRSEPGPFSGGQIQLLKSFADQAVIAIENVRLFDETKEALEQQRASGEVLTAISSSISDTKPVFDVILQSCQRLFTGETVGITLLREDGMLDVDANVGPGFDQLGKAMAFPHPLGRDTASGTAILDRRVTIYPDINDGTMPAKSRDGALAIGTQSMIVAPMIFEGRAIGTLWVGRSFKGPFPGRQIALLKTFADQAVIAIQNARLFREIEEKNRELAAASRHKSEFLANMSHELRTPLNAIIGFSEVLAERMFGEINDKQAEYLADILGSGRHLLSLINDILDLSKIEAGRMELEATDFDLPIAIESTLVLVRERAHRRGITLAHTIDERLAMIRGDERKVKQVLLNLLSNALKFTPEGGQIGVQAELRDGAAEISVTDTGVGIAPEDQEAVFEEFRQVGTASKKVEGTGLGLAISRKFIELHGGRIWVESQFGKGSTFAFTLPLQ